jgi:cation transport regulator ChaC
MNPNIDLEIGEVLMVREEEVVRSEMHEMATLQPHDSTIASAVLPVFTSQDVDYNDPPEAQGVTSTVSYHSMRSGSNIDNLQHNVNDATSDQPTRAGQGPSQAEAQTRVYFPTIVENSMT